MSQECFLLHDLCSTLGTKNSALALWYCKVAVAVTENEKERGTRFIEAFQRGEFRVLEDDYSGCKCQARRAQTRGKTQESSDLSCHLL